MKYSFILLAILMSINTLAQNAAKQKMESRAKDMIAAISQPNKDAYRKFIKSNYTEALINKKMRLNVEGGPGVSENEKSDPMEEKVNMYARLHDDLGEGKIISMKQTGEKLEVEAQGSTGLSMSFGLTFQKEEPFLIEGMSVQLTMRR